jgi:Plasmid recombination enzyme
MKTPLYFSAKTIGMSKRDERKPQMLHAAARHNLRELQAESGGHEGISLDLSHLNVTLHGPATPKGIVDYANEIKSRYAVPKRKLRKDHVQALEFVISVRNDSDIDSMAYFRASVRWLMDVFGTEMLLSAVVHFDEGAPHMHALVLPIMDGQYQGGAPIDKPHLPKLTKRFADQVGKPFGLSFEGKQKMHTALREAAFNLVVDHLAEQADPVVSSQIWPGVVQNIKHEPEKFVEMLGLKMPDVPRKKDKTFAQIMTGTGKKTSEDRDRRRSQDLSCVGQRNFSAPISAQESAHEAT